MVELDGDGNGLLLPFFGLDILDLEFQNEMGTSIVNLLQGMVGGYDFIIR